jgi:hypothetical protein
MKPPRAHHANAASIAASGIGSCCVKLPLKTGLFMALPSARAPDGSRSRCKFARKQARDHVVQLIVMIKKGLGRQIGNGAASGPERDQDRRHPCCRRGLAVGDGVANKKRAAQGAPAALHRSDIGRGVGFADGQRIGPHQRIEQRREAEAVDKVDGQFLGFVGADRRRRPRARRRVTASTTPGYRTVWTSMACP